VNGNWFINGSVLLNQTISLNSSLSINGSLTLSNSSVIVLAPNANISVTGCVSLGGSVTINVGALSQALNDTVNVISFDGYCSGQPTQFTNVTVVVDGAPPCSRTSNEAVYGPRSVSVIYSYDLGGCATPESSGLAVGAIVGIAVAAFFVVVIIVAVIAFGACRHKIMPYSKKRDEAAHQELE
jgi:hypothetical protein